MIAFQFAYRFQQENSFQPFIPVRDYDIKTSSGDLLNRTEYLRASLDVELKVIESLTQGA